MPHTRSTAFRSARKLAAFVAKECPQLLPLVQRLCKGLDPIQFRKGSRSIYLWDRLYFLSGDQSLCMWHLVNAYKNKTPDVSIAYLEEILNPGRSQFKLSHVWRDHPAWGTRIQPGETRGAVRLTPPDISANNEAHTKRTPTTHGSK